MRALEIFAAQLDREAPTSRRVLERVPEGRNDWKPHPKSMPLGYLATLVATMPSWVALTLDRDELDLAPPGGGGLAPRTWSTNAELLALHDEAVEQARASLGRWDDDHLLTPWRLLHGGRVVMEMPRHAVLGDDFCHLAHHRGQLSVYLRLNDVPLPSIYGPTADERLFG